MFVIVPILDCVCDYGKLYPLLINIDSDLSGYIIPLNIDSKYNFDLPYSWGPSGLFVNLLCD